MITAVIFDFGGVLCHFPPPSQTAALAALAGAAHDDFLRAFWGNRIPYDTGVMPPQDYWARIAQQLGTSYTSAQVDEFRRHDVGFWSNFDPAMLQWVETLRARGFRTGLLSNLPPDLGEHLRRSPGFLDRFDHVTYSYEVGVVKPQREIYEHALRGLGVAAREALFLDDRPENTRAAVELGIPSITFTSREHAARHLPPELPPIGG